MNIYDEIKEFSYTTELHAHTFPVSACGDFSAAEVVKFYCEAGVNSLVLTNHLNPLWAEGDLRERAKEYLSDIELALDAASGKINVILGVEIRFPENKNDYLVYGVSHDDIEHFISLIPYGIENFYKNVKNEKNVILQAHPFRSEMELAPLSSIDGIESMNMHPNHNGKLSLAFRYARQHNLIVSGGSDFHHRTHQALCLMRTKTEMKNSFDVAAALLARSAIFDCSGHIILPYASYL